MNDEESVEIRLSVRRTAEIAASTEHGNADTSGTNLRRNYQIAVARLYLEEGRGRQTLNKKTRVCACNRALIWAT